MALLSVDKALSILLSEVHELSPERVPLSVARGRVLSADLAAQVTHPPFDASAMDGYAVRAADVSMLPVALEVVGKSVAGARFGGRVGPGQAVRILTGAPMPEGADCIVLQEDTESEGDQILVRRATPGQYIRPRGLDFHDGAVLLVRGTKLDARAVMLSASMNHAEVPVVRRPRVAILCTGDEVVRPGSPLGRDQIVSSVGFGIAALVAAEGAEAIDLGIAPDDPERTAALVRTGAGADIVLTVGGASVGERDFVLSALQDDGLKLQFSKVAMRPGKPAFYGRLRTQHLLGVPGNPVSAFICSYVFLLPMLRKMLGRPESVLCQPLEPAVLGGALGINGMREHYMRAVSEWREDGVRVVTALPSQDSSLAETLTRADCLIVRRPGAKASLRGARVQILPFVS